MITLIVLLTLLIMACAFIVTVGAPLLFIIVDLAICIAVVGAIVRRKKRSKGE